MMGLFSAVRRDYGPGGVRVELGHVGILPVWGENNRNDLAGGRTKTPVIHPILIDREMPLLQARLDELNKKAEASKTAAGTGTNASAPALTPDEQEEFIEVTSQLKLLDDRRQQILVRTGDEYVTDPPRLPARP
jgi:hypothetical protein